MGGALPEPLKTELELRGIRADALTGQLEAAGRALIARMALSDRPAACGKAEALCTKLIGAALGSEDPATRAVGLEVWLRLEPAQQTIELTTLAASAAAGMGAPRYAGDLLAAVTPAVSPSALEPHLLTLTSYYLQASDLVRAGVILDFARARLGDKRLTSARWRPLVTRAEGREAPKRGGLPVGTAEAIATECQHADAALLKARQVGAPLEETQ